MKKPHYLCKIRKEKGWTQEDVCRELKKYNCCISRSTYSKYETGKRHPSVEMIVKLAQCFEISTDCLLGVTEYSKPVNVRLCANEMCIYYFYQKCMLDEIYIDRGGFCGSCVGAVKGEENAGIRRKKFLELVDLK